MLLLAALIVYPFLTSPFTILHAYTIGRTTQCPPMLQLNIVRERLSNGETTLRGIDMNADSADEITHLWETRPEDVVEFRTLAGPQSEGLVAVTRREWIVQELPLWSNFSAAEMAQARTFFANWVSTKGYPSAAARVLSGNRVDIIWSGVAWTIAFSLASLAFLVSLGWMLPGSAFRAARALRKHQCPKCRYDLSGAVPTVEKQVTCPECGSTWPAP